MNRGFCNRGLRRHNRPFKNAGYRSTQARQIILGVLIKAKEHLSADEIYNRSNKINEGINLTTIYRNLDVLVELGALNKFDFGDGRWRFELTETDEVSNSVNHHHLVCVECGRIFDFECSSIDKHLSEIEKVQSKYNFQIKDHLIQFKGLCSKCRE